jgi:hypothetical protein
MNTLELLYNKALMKAAADKAENVVKAKVWLNINHEIKDRSIWIVIYLSSIYIVNA